MVLIKSLNQSLIKNMDIKAIIGLGNPGPKFDKTRHNIGFRVIDQLALRYNAQWRTKDAMELAELQIHGKPVLLVKPQTFMNSSGEVLPFLTKKGINAENLLVVHDELELPFGSIKLKTGGSAKGHNGLKSIISYIGDAFHRIRFGIDRPANREVVPNYVLSKFTETEDVLLTVIEEAVDLIEDLFA